MTHPSLVQIILGCGIFFAAIIWIVAEAIYLSRRLRSFFGSVTRPTTHVDQTVNQMFGDVHTGERQYADTRHARNEIQGGNPNAKP